MSERFEQMERPGVNAFGFQNYEIRDVLADREIEAVIQSMFQNSFRRLGITDEKLDWVEPQDTERSEQKRNGGE